MKLSGKAFVFLISLWSLSGWAQDSDIDYVPNDFYIASIPNLPNSGPFRLSWGFYRPPYVWLQEKLVDLSKVRWPQFDRDQVPPTLSPEPSSPAFVIIENSRGEVIDTIKLEKPFSVENYSNDKGQVPAGYRIRVEAIPERLFLTSKRYPWFRRKEVFKCEIPIPKGTVYFENKRLQTCLRTIANLANGTDQQWYANIQWPSDDNNDNSSFVSEQDREIKGIFRKNNHIMQSERVLTRLFVARAGVTRNELVPTVEFPVSQVKQRDLISLVPPKEKQTQKFDEQILADGSRIEAMAFSGDFVEGRELTMPGLAKPRAEIQFIPSLDGQLHLRKTEFKEVRVGLGGILRPWQGEVFADYNSISSNRGERDSFLDLPGLELSYKTNFWNLTGYGFYQSGLIHSGSTLSISELQVGAKQDLSEIPWAKLGAGFHQYSLSGRNPGSTRLGKVDAVALGIWGNQLIDRTLVRGHLNLMYSNTLGYEGIVEYGRLLDRRTDFRFYYGIYLGYARYASTILNRLSTNETFSEDRMRLGVSFGFLGPDSL